MKNLILLSLVFIMSNANAGSWNGNNDPANLNANYNYQFNQLPLSGSVAADQTPWSDNYWESDWSGIALRWNTLTVAQRDPDLFDYTSVDKQSLFEYTPPTLDQLRTMSREDLLNLSPAEKYDIFMGQYTYPTVAAERARTNPDTKDWQGICHGWVPASINVPEPGPIDMTNADGIVVPFGSSDVKGLLSHYYAVTAYNFARGSRTVVRNGSIFEWLNQVDSFDPIAWINFAADAVVFNSSRRQATVSNTPDSSTCTDEQCVMNDSFGSTVDSLNLVGQVGARPTLFGNSDPNPGAFFVVVSNQLGLMHHAFAANLNLSGSNTQIWNQPVSGFSTTVDYDNRNGGVSGTVGLTTVLSYVSEIPQNYNAVVGTANERIKTMTFSYEVEIDSNGNVTGGSWKHGTHPGFLWAHGALPIQGYFGKLMNMIHSN